MEMKNCYLLETNEGIKPYIIVFSEIDSKWHFLDVEKENVRWREYDTTRDATDILEYYKEQGLIRNYYPGDADFFRKEQ